MAFGEQWIPIAGVPGPIISMTDELQQSYLPAAGMSFLSFRVISRLIPVLNVRSKPKFPYGVSRVTSQLYEQVIFNLTTLHSSMVYFQFVFAAITLVIMSGAFLGRMNPLAWMIFVPLWLTLSYCVGAFSIWAGGFLYQLGVIDYSGGYVIHLSSGTAGWVGAMCIGPRLKEDRIDKRPNNALLVMVGAGILWTGWNGFNGGDPYAASADAGVAVLNTNICTAMSLLTWTALDVMVYKKPSLIGAVQGMITGLVAITPAAGVIAGWGAIVMGVLSGSIPWVSMNVSGTHTLFSLSTFAKEN